VASAGEFYMATERTSFVLARAPLCLSHHPQGPLAEEG
jgi:hypothetical protein